jgi:phytol kinase
MIELAIVAVSCLAAFFLFEVVAVQLKFSSEVIRKLAHMGAGVGSALLPLWLTHWQIAITALLVIPIVLFSMRRQIFKTMHRVGRVTYGELYFPIAIIACSLLFQDNLPYMYSLMVIGVADALASIIGMRYGRKTFSLLGSHKSFAGSLTFFAATLIIGLLLLPVGTGLGMVPTALLSVLLAVPLTLIEAASSKGIDNLLVPLAAGGLVSLLQFSGFLS